MKDGVIEQTVREKKEGTTDGRRENSSRVGCVSPLT